VKRIRKAVVASAFSGLEVVPDAFLKPAPFLRATKAGETCRRLIGWTVASSHIQLKFNGNLHFEIAEESHDFPYYDRGPE
jgi:hypothetical protein